MGNNKITPNVAKWLNDISITKQDAHDAFGPDAVVHDLTQAEMDASTGVLTKGGVSTQDGAIIYDVLAAANTPTRETSIYDSTLSRKVAPSGRRNVARASLPATGQIGEKFYVTDLQIEVEWRNAADDLLLAGGGGIAGWHPTNGAYALMTNKSGSTVAAHNVVIYDTADDNTRKFNTTTTAKHQSVVGVTLESITSGSNGYVALVEGGATVPVFVLGSTFGAVAKGDVLVCSTTAGAAREAGPAVGATLLTATTYANGVQRGGFAIALAAQAADDVVMCRLLGSVGTGMMVLTGRSSVWSDTTPPNAFTTINAELAASGTNGAQGASSLVDASHSPIVAWQGSLVAEGSSGTYTAWDLQFSTDALTIQAKVARAVGDLSNPEYAEETPIPWMPLTAGTVQLKYTAGSGAVTWTAFTLNRTGYIC